MGRGFCILSALFYGFVAFALFGMGVDFGLHHGGLWTGLGGYIIGGFFAIMAGLWLKEAL
jgi:hypothetical protein